MALEQKVSEEMKAAMKSGEKLRLETMRSIRAAILEFKTSGVNRDMEEADEQKILIAAAKRRKDAMEMYKQAGRDDLHDKEAAELKIIEEFLPKQMTEKEIIEFVAKLIADTGAVGMKDLGKIMGPAMKQLSGKADGSVVQRIVKEKLS